MSIYCENNQELSTCKEKRKEKKQTNQTTKQPVTSYFFFFSQNLQATSLVLKNIQETAHDNSREKDMLSYFRRRRRRVVVTFTFAFWPQSSHRSPLPFSI
jgi:hypothetical protein